MGPRDLHHRLPATPCAWLARFWRWLLLPLLVHGVAAQAASHDFPSSMPPGCSGTNGSYTCPAMVLGSADTLSISGTGPITVTFSGDLNVNGAKVNQAGSANNLTLVVNGQLTPGYQGVINAHVRAYSVNDANGGASFGGSLQATAGAISLGYQTSVAGAITGSSTVTLGDWAVAGSSVSTSGNVSTGYRSRVDGSITAGGSITVGQETTVGGAISTTGAGSISIGYGATARAAITSGGGQVSLAQNAVVDACVQVPADGNGIVLGYQATAAAVCCGSAGSCSTSCVTNNSNNAMPAACAGPATLIAKYDFNETGYAGSTGELKDSAGHASGPFNGQAQGAPLPTVASASPARTGSPGTCSYASLPGPDSNGGGFIITGLPVSTTAGAKTSVSFWMYWDGSTGVMPIGWQAYDLWFQNGGFGFNTDASDLYGTADAGLSRVWRHVVAVFVNGSVTSNKLYIDGVLQTLSHRTASTTPSAANAVVGSTLHIAGFGVRSDHRMAGAVDQVRVYDGELSASEVSTLHAEAATCAATGPHHLEIQHASGSGLTCTPSAVTVMACADAACSAGYTGGVSGTLGATGGSVVWPGGAGFSIAAGQSSTTVALQATTTTATVLGVASSTPGGTSTTTCNFGSPACTFTAADSGLLFDVPHHVSETTQTVSVSAVKKADNSLACVPAFASVSRSLNFSCAYGTPSSGTRPVRVGGVALNAAGNAAAACDGNGKALSLAFNASGVASTTLQYADVGQMTLNARYTGSAGSGDTGLVMSGSDSFIAAPDHFSIDNTTAGPIRAGSSFSATVTVRNALGNTTPNYGRETWVQRVNLGWATLQPTGSGAVVGSFSGSGARSFSGGTVTASDLAWTEVGRGDLVARGSDANGYLGSGLHVFGSSLAAGAHGCAIEGADCVLPGGTTATVYYGAPGGWAVKPAQTGTVGCNNSTFGDPIRGPVKRCFYVASTATNGSVGDFIPHRFSVAAPNACGSFTYAGQPATATVTALNAAGNATLNYNGSATTTPTFAQAVTLSDANALGLGTLTGGSIAASAFVAGVATAQVRYDFSTKTTAPQSLLLRASNGAPGTALVSSLGGTEATLALRSGRLRLSNAFGSATAPLQLAAATDYWNGSAWLLNSADSCTSLAGTSVALGNPRSATGAASAATTSAGALAISGGNGLLTLAAPSPAGSSLSLDLALNLGSTTTDQSCQASHPTTTGAGKPWLRALNGSCATTADRDPAARASFGIFAPETRKTIHVRDIH